MNVKEKARELVNKFYFMPSSRILYEDVKQFALIALEMEYKASVKMLKHITDNGTVNNSMSVKAFNYVLELKDEYDQVKQEIEKL